MSPPKQRTLRKREGKNHHKRVCRHCKLQFDSGRALGGHLKVHYKDRKKSNFTQRKGSSKTKTPDSTTTTREIVHLSNSLFGFGWKLRKRRGSIARNTTIVSAHDYESDVEYGYDENEDKDEDGLTVMERLRSYGFGGNTHMISMTRRYLCKSCNVYLPTFHAVLVHVNDHNGCSGTTDSVEVDVQGGGREEVGVDHAEVSMDVLDDQKEDEEVDGEVEDLGMGDEEEEYGEICVETSIDIAEKEDDYRGLSYPTSFEIDQVVENEEELLKVADEEARGNAAAVEGEVVQINAGLNEEDETVVGAKDSTQVVDDKVVAAGNNGSADQEVSTSNRPKMLDFDLNELPPKED